jgi:hypothetical protein
MTNEELGSHYNEGPLGKAMLRWENTKSPGSFLACEEFAKLIGYPRNPHGGNYDPTSPYIVDVSNPAVRRVIDVINGPYGDAVLKILEIRNAQRHTDNKGAEGICEPSVGRF